MESDIKNLYIWKTAKEVYVKKYKMCIITEDVA